MDADSGRLAAGARLLPKPRRPETAGIVAFGPFRLDGKRRLLTAAGIPVVLQPRAFDLLELLVACAGQLLSQDEIVGHVWRGVAVGDNNLGVQLSALRRVLAEHGGSGLIVTVPGRGYRFVADVTDVPSSSPPDRGASPAPAGPPKPSWRATRRQMGFAAAAAVALAVALAALIPRPALIPQPAQMPADTNATSFDPPPHSIAVLTFANLSGDPAQDYLSDGIAEAVIDVLSRVPPLQVTARTSSFYFKGRQATIDQIARRLNVGAILEGSLRRQGTHQRVDAHLSDARTGYQLWSQSYDLEAGDVLKLQDDIAGAVARALQATLLETNPARHMDGGTTIPQAFDAYLRAEHDVLDGAFDKGNAAIAEFRKAVALDPDFALALIGLSQTLAIQAAYNISAVDPEFREVMGEARQAAEHAVKIAPNLGLAHAQIAAILLGEPAGAAAAWAAANRATSLAPGDAAVQEGYANVAMALGRRDEAVKAAALAVGLDPLRAESWFTTMRSLACTHQFAKARDALRRGNEILGHPTSWTPFIEGSLLAKEGRFEAARDVCLTPARWNDECLAIVDHALGRQNEADAAVARMVAQDGDNDAYNFARIYAQWGQPARAMRWLAKARDLHDTGLSELACDAWMDPIRSQPGFSEIELSLHHTLPVE